MHFKPCSGKTLSYKKARLVNLVCLYIDQMQCAKEIN